MSLDSELFDQWLKAYGKAWERGDPEAVLELFAEDARYHETPFDKPLRGLDAIHRYWTEGADQGQTDVAFRAVPLLVSGKEAHAHWQAKFRRVPSGSFVQLDGMLSAEFNEHGKCTVFREWWHRKETPTSP